MITLLWLQMDLASETPKYGKLLLQIQELQKQSRALYDSVLTNESLTIIEKEARAKGFVDEKFVDLP